MRLENQVCTLQQAIKLKELGLSQDSLFCHTGDWKSEITHQSIELTKNVYSGMAAWAYDTRYAAFTVAELGIMLSSDFPLRNEETAYVASNCKGAWINAEVGLLHIGDQGVECFLGNEASSRAGLLIFLIEHGFLTVEEVNQRFMAE